MSDDSTKTSSLGVSNTIAANDRILIVRIPNVGNPTTNTISLTKFVANGFPIANSSALGVIKVGNNLLTNSSGFLNTVGLTNNVVVGGNTLVIVNGLVVNIA